MKTKFSTWKGVFVKSRKQSVQLIQFLFSDLLNNRRVNELSALQLLTDICLLINEKKTETCKK